MDDKELDTIFKEDIVPILSKQPLTPSSQPKGYVLGGQPGAGKSKLLKLAETQEKGNLAVINADEFRKFHPQFEEFAKDHGLEAANHTAAFAGAMVQKAMKHCIENRFNLAIEGTFRTAETPLKTLKELQGAGYKTEVMVNTCPKDVSWTSTLNRYTEAVTTGMGAEARFTPKEAHDQTVEKLAANVKTVTEQIGNISVFNRSGLMYQGSDPTKAAQSVQQELTRPLTQAEYQVAKKNHEDVLKVMQGAEKAPLLKGQAAFLIRHQNKADIDQHPEIKDVQRKIDSIVTGGQRSREEVAESHAKLIEKGSIKLSSPSLGRGMER